MGSRHVALRRILSFAVLAMLLAATLALLPANSLADGEPETPWGLNDSIVVDTGGNAPAVTATEAEFNPLYFLNLLTSLMI